MKKKAIFKIMLSKNAIIFVSICFFFIAECYCTEDSILRKTQKEIQLFQLSNQKKFLNANISRNLGLITHSSLNSVDKMIYYSHIQNLLNNGFVEDSYAIILELEKELNFKNENECFDYYFWLGNIYRIDQQYDSANYYYEKALKLSDQNMWSEKSGKVHYNLGKSLSRMGVVENAMCHFRFANSKISIDTFALSQSKRRLSSIYSQRNEHDLAMGLINQALNLYLSTKNSSEKIINPLEYSKLMQNRAYVYRQMAKSNFDSLDILKLSLRDAKKSILTFEKSKRSLVFESDIVYSNSMYKYFYSKTIEAISRITDINQSDSLIYQALQYAEMDKSSALLRTVQKEIALEKSNIPGSTIHYLKNLYLRLSKVEAKRFEENANVRVNDSALYDLNMELFDLVSEITQFEKQLEKEHPVYADEKYRVTPPNLDFILEQSYDKAILEYVVSDEKLYMFLIVNGKIHFHHYYYRNDFILSVEKLQRMVADINSIEYSLDELNEFETISHQLYNELIAPFDSIIGERPLLIVPDEQLSLIPFEVLLTEKHVSKSINYTALPYLVKQNDISYAYSLTLSHKQKNIMHEFEHDALLAMAPTYDGLAGNQGSQYIALRATFREARDELGMLKGARKEAKHVTKQVKGTLYLDNEASEEQFKKNAPNYKVLHLAMHTLINNEDPLYSKLVFTPDADEKDDGLLNTYELNNMKLNAELVVLSACNTGFGKLNKGEGIIGLTRGFLQAGCKSLLATLWSVADKASAELINDFYTGIKNGNTKSGSLSEAKRKYIESAKGRNAHPFFWAAYISIGDDSQVELKQKTKLHWYLLVITFALINLYLLFVRKK